MISMTGYGFGEYQDKEYQISLDIKSYNNRYLDIVVNLPSSMNQLEPNIRNYISENAGRGRIEVYLKIKELGDNLQVSIDPSLVNSYAGALKQMAKTAGLSQEISLDHLLKMEGVLKIEREHDVEKVQPLVEKLLCQVYKDFDQSRKVEGQKTKDDILEQLDVLRKYTEDISSQIPTMEGQIQNTLRDKLSNLDLVEIEESRILAETAMLIVRYDVNEEVVRLKAHIESFHEIAHAPQPSGKKLDFLCQEINREINTLGSKTMLLKVQQDVVEMKNSLEKIREQLRNVE